MMYLCQYGNCQKRNPRADTYIVGLPRKNGAKRYCSPEHAALAVLRVHPRWERLVMGVVNNLGWPST